MGIGIELKADINGEAIIKYLQICETPPSCSQTQTHLSFINTSKILTHQIIAISFLVFVTAVGVQLCIKIKIKLPVVGLLDPIHQSAYQNLRRRHHQFLSPVLFNFFFPVAILKVCSVCWFVKVGIFRNNYLFLKLPMDSRRDVFASGWKVGLLFYMKFKNGVFGKSSYSYDGINSIRLRVVEKSGRFVLLKEKQRLNFGIKRRLQVT